MCSGASVVWWCRNRLSRLGWCMADEEAIRRGFPRRRLRRSRTRGGTWQGWQQTCSPSPGTSFVVWIVIAYPSALEEEYKEWCESFVAMYNDWSDHYPHDLNLISVDHLAQSLIYITPFTSIGIMDPFWATESELPNTMIDPKFLRFIIDVSDEEHDPHEEAQDWEINWWMYATWMPPFLCAGGYFRVRRGSDYSIYR